MTPLTPVAALRWARLFESSQAVRSEVPVCPAFASFLNRMSREQCSQDLRVETSRAERIREAARLS